MFYKLKKIVIRRIGADWLVRRRRALPLVIALVGLGINIVVAASMAGTADEGAHIRYGAAIIRRQPDRSSPWWDSKMPITALNAFPQVVGRRLRNHGAVPLVTNVLLDIRTARYATIATAFALCFLVFVYAESLFGTTGGLFAELIFVMDPNIIAHSTLSTTDLYIAFASVLFLYSVRRFLLSPDSKSAAIAAGALALAQLTKFNATYLVLIPVVVFLVASLPISYARGLRERIPRRSVVTFVVLTVVFFLAVINAGFLFDRTFTPLANFKFQSAGFQSLQRHSWLGAVPLPVPYPYVRGFDMVSYNGLHGSTFGNMALLNEVRGPDLPRSDGFWSYYFIAYLLKEPIGMQLILVISLIWIFRNRSMAELVTGEGLLLATAAVFILVPSFFGNAQMGIRHILPSLVIFAILSGAAFQAWTKTAGYRKIALGACLAYSAASVATYFPHMIPYFNEFLTDRKFAYRYLADSNLDWGQDKWEVERFLKNNPDVILDPQKRVAGRVLMSANYVAGVYPREANNFVRVEGLQPISQVGYGHFLFIVPQKP